MMQQKNDLALLSSYINASNLNDNNATECIFGTIINKINNTNTGSVLATK